MKNAAVLRILPLDFQWPIRNPFLFCAHHNDAYPPGNGRLGPDASLRGRSLGHDFVVKDGWRMYHGKEVPGFPVHPHRGFETVTIVLEGWVDHCDSHGQAGRYGQGDVQWMTAGSGLQHSEMFPLLYTNQPNPLELFQVWLNLPKSKKFAEPYYKMLWSEDIPVYRTHDDHGKKIAVRINAGSMEGVEALKPAPDSWASDPKNEVGIWNVDLQSGARWTMPVASPDVHRTLYFHKGSSIKIEGQRIDAGHAVEVLPEVALQIEAVGDDAKILVLQGRPIDEPVVQYGPFVMNSMEEIRQAFYDYEKTSFGGWPWDRDDSVFPSEVRRFARYKDGKEEHRLSPD
jgi:redox-sensitive bicupin YhaK (pirin superfamily)